ncbi:MAG: serine/threonine-protein kinase [Mycobacteriales bacterium]|nr:serine/threonine-protein kinase [Mycobacteriales bacterium]
MDTTDRTVGGRYRLLEPLGSGGMGTVWRAQDLVLDREVAVKEVAPPHGVSDDERDVLRERTRREARSAAQLDHPSAVTVYDVVEDDDRPYLVMELVEARTLSDVVRTDGPLSPRRTAEVGLAVLGALQAAHAVGIVHRDVKPGNVLVRDDGRVVLTDFGIATSTGDSSITHTGLILGSPSYIAPERARGQAPGPESDLWSLGATLFTAVEGRPPFDGGEPLLTVTAVVTGDHAPFVAAGPLREVLEGLLEKDPALRLDAAAATAALTAVAQGSDATLLAQPQPAAERRTEGTQALPLVDVRAAAARPRRGRARVAGPALLLVTALAAGGTYALTRDDSGAPGTGAEGVTVPADWATHTEPGAGWSVRHPKGWVVSERRGLRQIRDESRRWTLRVDTTDTPGTDPAAAWEQQEIGFRRAFPSYSRVRIEPVDYRGWDAADWEFTFRDGGADLRTLDRGFVVDGTGYALYWQTGAADFAASLPTFERIAASFRPA